MKTEKLTTAVLGPSILGICVAAATPAAAQDAGPYQSVFAVGGAMVDGDMTSAANPFGADYEDPVLGIGYQLFPYELGSLRLGVETGLVGRFGDDNTSAEIWGGLVARYDAITLADRVKIIPSFTFGLSHVTRTQEGREAEQEEKYDGDASTLFYLGPELSFALVDRPQFEVFWRVHHRSGAWETLGDMRGGANSNLVGVRYNF